MSAIQRDRSNGVSLMIVDYALASMIRELPARCIRNVEERWAGVLDDTKRDPKGAHWNIQAADQLRREAGAPHRWIAGRLAMDSEPSLRSYLGQRISASVNLQSSV
jgi:hypothetical protein